jgi:hypothetical protein
MIRILSKITSSVYLRTGQILMIITFFLIMSYDSCNEQGGKPEVRGYELIYTSKQWEGGPDTIEGNVKYLYVFSIICSVAIFVLSVIKKNRIIYSGFFKIFAGGIIKSTFIFSCYFGLYGSVWFNDLHILISILFLLYWNFSSFNKPPFSAPLEVKYLRNNIIGLLPFIILSFITVIRNYYYRNGWIYFYTSLWLFIIGITFSVKKAKEENKVIPEQKSKEINKSLDSVLD